MLRVPASKRRSLLKAKADGADVRMVYSVDDALKIARQNPSREVVFFAIGFETTTPPTAVAIRKAKAEGLKNFSVFCNHVLTPAALQAILGNAEESGSVSIDAFLGPSHVSSVIGSKPYEYFAREYKRPVVIAGFEPLDVMQATLMAIRQLNEGRHVVENQYVRVVTREGNVKAQKLVAEVLELRPSFEWRGLGEVPDSALRIREAYADFDAERRFSSHDEAVARCEKLRMPVHPARREKADRLQAVRHGLHARQPHRLLHGVIGRSVRGLLDLWPVPAACAVRGCGMTRRRRPVFGSRGGRASPARSK